MEIRSAVLADIPPIKGLMEDTFGRFDRIAELFQKWITQANYSVWVAIEEKKIVGVSSWHLKVDDDLSKYETFGESAIRFMKGKKSAWAINLAVVPEMRRRGLGTRLALSAREWLNKQDCEIVVGSSWVNGHEGNSSVLFRKAGFQVLGKSSDFLRQQMQHGAECAACMSSDCHCESILFGTEYLKFERFASSLNLFENPHHF